MRTESLEPRRPERGRRAGAHVHDVDRTAAMTAVRAVAPGRPGNEREVSYEREVSCYDGEGGRSALWLRVIALPDQCLHSAGSVFDITEPRAIAADTYRAGTAGCRYGHDGIAPASVEALREALLRSSRRRQTPSPRPPPRRQARRAAPRAATQAATPRPSPGTRRADGARGPARAAR
jgi:hypothetical protein